MLLSMGFAQNRAVKALQLNGDNPEKAITWLLTHESDPDIDVPLPGTL